MEHHQSAQGFEILVALLCVVAVIIFTAFYLTFIRKSNNPGH